jgi:hypothetical protein
VSFSRFPFSRRSISSLCVLCFGIILLIAPGLYAADLAHLKSLVSELASDNPHQRDSAVNELMNINRKDLPALRIAAISQEPLLPVQISSLRQIVPQVFLAGEKFQYDPDDPRGFLGVQFGPETAIIQGEGVQISEGVRIYERIWGFPAYRFLQPQDVIVRILDQPDVPMRRVSDFIRIAGLFHPGEVMHLEILRRGLMMNVSVPLDFRPVAISRAENEKLEVGKPSAQEKVDAWIAGRKERANTYWKEEFSIIDPANSPDTEQASASAR